MKRYMMIGFLPYFLLLLVMCLLSACDHKELCYGHPHGTSLTLVFDWSEAPEASPQGMCAFFYPADAEGQVLRYDFTGREGGVITVHPTFSVMKFA